MNDPLYWFSVHQLSIDTKERKKFFHSTCLQPEDSGIQEVKKNIETKREDN
jgi:hypothetical protein